MDLTVSPLFLQRNEAKWDICKPLSIIFNQSINSGLLPAEWKKARIIPIYKKGDSSDPSNYRPIALTSIPCKVMERIIHSTMLNFIKENNILSEDQFGFLPGRSTCLQLLSVLEDLTCSVDDGIPLDVVLIDFAKAFESVVHDKLVAKLDWYGFRGNLLSWLKDFLSERLQYVVVGKSESNIQPVQSGVPQGSVLGPLLFVLFLNDLKITNEIASLYKFADDVELHSQVDTCTHLGLVNAVNTVFDWSTKWQLPIAPSKCSVLPIGCLNNNFSYTVSGDLLLPHVDSARNLGVWFTSDINFHTHCNMIVKTANQRVAWLKKVFCTGDPTILISAFKAYVRPILEYASPVWSPHLLGDIDHIESVQRRFTKSLRGLKGKPYLERLKLFNLDSLELRRLKADLYLTFSLLHGLLDFNFTKFFELRADKRTRGHPFKLVVGSFNKDCRKYFFANRVVNAWNSLPGELVMSNTLNCFKKELRNVDLTSFLRRGLNG